MTNEVKQRLFIEVNILLWTQVFIHQQVPLTLKPPQVLVLINYKMTSSVPFIEAFKTQSNF